MKRRDFWGVDEYEVEAQRLYESSRYGEALALLREGVTRYPESADLWVSKGYTHLALEAFVWARSAFERALDLESDHEEALVGLGDALLKLGERARAFLAFERVLEQGFENDESLMVAIARALYREELFERAIRFYRLAVDRPEAEAELGYALYQLGRRHEARIRLERALERDSELHEARAFYANLLYEAGDYAGALDHFVRVPVGQSWDALAVWRTIELLRGIRGLSSDAPEMRLYLERLELLSEEPGPEEQLLAEVWAEAGDGAERVPARDRQQLDLFALEPSTGPGRDPSVHALRARDGRVYMGDWVSIVRALRDDSSDPSISIAEFMRDSARLVRNLTGLDVPDDDPEAFLKASARAGIFHIEG